MPFSLSKNLSAHLAWLLALLVVAQNLLPIQSHTNYVTTESGQTILMCTLHGLQPADITSMDKNALLQLDISSAAMQFSDLLSYATQALAFYSLQIHTVVELSLKPLPKINFSPFFKRSHAIRAPPTFLN